MRERARGSLQVDFTEIKIAELHEIAHEVYDTGMELQVFMTANGIFPRERENPIREPLNRKRSARQARREQHGSVY